MDRDAVALAQPIDSAETSVPALYERHARRIFAFACRLGISSNEAEDVVQETFARLLRSTAERTVRKPDVWLYRTAHNLAMDRHRAARGIRLIDVSGAAGGAAFEASTDHDLWAAVDRLSNRQRAVIYLRFRADFDFATIGRVLSMSPITARVTAIRALRRLRSEVER